MNKPSKKQLVDSVTHFQNGLKALVESGSVTVDALQDLLDSAPSLVPVAKVDETTVVTATVAETVEV